MKPKKNLLCAAPHTAPPNTHLSPGLSCPGTPSPHLCQSPAPPFTVLVVTLVGGRCVCVRVAIY